MRRSAGPIGVGISLCSLAFVAPAHADEDIEVIEVDAAPTSDEDETPSDGGAGDDDGDEDNEQDAAETDAPRDPIEVRVIGNKADAMQKVPGSGTIIRPKEMRSADPQDVAEMLRRVPGLTARQDEGAGGRLDIGVRGLDPGRSRRVLMLEDGIPLSINPYAEPDMYYAPPVERMQGIEVVKGSGSILFGPQTTGGVINFLSKPAPYRRQVRLATSAGQRGFFRGVASYGDAHGTARHITQVMYQRGDGFRGVGFSKLNMFSKVAFETSDQGQATIKLGFHDQTAIGDDVGLTSAMFAADPRRATLQPGNRQDLRRFDASVVHEHHFSEHVALRTLAYGYVTTRLWQRRNYDRFPMPGVHYTRIVGNPGTPNGAIYFRDSATILDRSYEVAGLEPRLQFRFDTGAVDHTVDFGARVLGEAAQYEQRATDTASSTAGALVLHESRNSLAFAGYLQDRMAFLDETILITPGARFENVSYRRNVNRQLSTEGARDVAITGKSNTQAVVPGIGFTFGRPTAHAFAGFHVGYAPPRIVSSINPNGIAQPLAAEKSFAYETGGRIRIKRIFSAELTGYLTNYTNQIVPSTSGAVTVLVNGGATRNMGLETGGRMSFGEWIEGGVLLDLGASYHLGRAKFVSGDLDGNELPYAPHHNLTTTLDVGHDSGFAAQVSYTFTGAQFTDDRNTVAEDVTGRRGRVDGYHLLDANVRYTHAATGLTGIVSAKNLTDDVFIIARRPEGIFASGFRQVTAGLRWAYDEEIGPPVAASR